MEFTQEQISETNRFIQKVYAWMFLGLLISGSIAFYTSTQDWLLTSIFGNKLVFYALLIFQLILVGGLVAFIKKIPSYLGATTFLLYCAITGLTLSVIFIVFEFNSIIQVFFIAAGMFGFISVYGYFTKTDLTGLGHILIMGLFGLILLSIVNLFIKNSFADIIISFIGVVIFTGLAAYDTQKIKKTNILGNEGTDEDHKEAVMGALTLYLDFVNLFLSLLKLFGKRRR
ncbi:MAG: Bax inhibitor-1/YccA family protein [Candidatus Micrarchaeota archaeon]